MGGTAPVCRTLRRIVAFGLAQFVDDTTYAVGGRIPPASLSRIRKLDPELRRLHEILLARHQAERTNAPVLRGA